MWSNRAEFELIRDIIIVLLTCMNEEDPIKNEGVRVLARLYMDFLDAQGQLTPKSMVAFCRNSNSSKLLWLSLLIFSNAQGQPTPQYVVESCQISNSFEI